MSLRQIRRQADRLTAVSLRVIPPIDVYIGIAEVQARGSMTGIVEQGALEGRDGQCRFAESVQCRATQERSLRMVGPGDQQPDRYG